MLPRAPRPSILAAGLVALFAATPARAVFHLWQIEEIFSNADGSIQYVEFFSSSQFPQNLMAQHVLDSLQGTTVVDNFTFPSDLGSPTQDHFFLVATPAFEAAAGIKPDYTFAPNQVFIHLGVTDTIRIEQASTTPFTFDPSALPTDGTHALLAMGGVFPAVVAAASPTNFAGKQGQLVPEPDRAPLAAAAFGALAGLARRRAR